MIVTQGPIDEALAYRRRVGNRMTWYSTANSPFGADIGAPPDGGFAVNVFLRDGEKVYRTWHTNGRGTEQLSYTFALIDVLPYGRQEEWQDSPDGWPQDPDLQPLARLPRHRRAVRPGGLTGGIGVRGWWWLRRRPCAPAGGDHRGELDGVPSGRAARASTSRARSSSGGRERRRAAVSSARRVSSSVRSRPASASRAGAQRGLRLHPLQGRPQPALGGAAGVGLLGRGVRGLRGPPVGVVAGGLGRGHPVPGVGLRGRRGPRNSPASPRSSSCSARRAVELVAQLHHPAHGRGAFGVRPLGAPRRLLHGRGGLHLRGLGPLLGGGPGRGASTAACFAAPSASVASSAWRAAAAARRTASSRS